MEKNKIYIDDIKCKILRNEIMSDFEIFYFKFYVV